jgi:hypothetical protein
MPKTSGFYGIEYTELEPYTENWQSGEIEIVRTLECAWSDRYHFVLDLTGWCQLIGGSILFRQPPEPHPEFNLLYCVQAQMVQGIGFITQGVNTAPQYLQRPSGPDINAAETDGRARFRCTFRSLDYEVGQPGTVPDETSRYVSRYETYAGESLPILSGGFVWVTPEGKPDGPVFEATTRIMRTKSLEHVWHDVPGDTFKLGGNLEANIEATIGKMNISPFDNGRYPARTLLFIAPDKKRTRTPAGFVTWTVKYQMLYRKTGWDKLYRRGGNDFQRVQRKDDEQNRSIYEEANFDKLFQFI